jgi:sec-independent protein translocase protein TatA
MPGWIGPWELLILLLVVLLVFGPKRLPEMGRSLGRGMREFKGSVMGKDDEPAELTAPAVEEPVAASTSSSKREHDAIG